MNENPDDKKAYFSIQRRINGWKLDVWMWGFDTVHIMATRTGRRRGWNFNRIYDRIDGVWVDRKFKDRWSIRYDRPYPGAPEDNWRKLYSPPGSARVAVVVRAMALRIARQKAAARWRAEGFYRSRKRREALERYFTARKDLDTVNARVTVTRMAYEDALANEKSYTAGTRPC